MQIIIEVCDLRASVPSLLRQYTVALAAVIAAIVVRWALDAQLGAHHPEISLHAATALAAWYSGVVPVAVGAVVGYFACQYLFAESGLLGLADPSGLSLASAPELIRSSAFRDPAPPQAGQLITTERMSDARAMAAVTISLTTA